MDLSAKSKVIKKRRKKKKLRADSKELEPLIMPELFDGCANWTRMQEVMGNTKVKILPQDSSGLGNLDIPSASQHNRNFKLNRNHLNTSHNSKLEQSHVHKSEFLKCEKKHIENLKGRPNTKGLQENNNIPKHNNSVYSSACSSDTLDIIQKTSSSEKFAFNFNEGKSLKNEVSNSHLNEQIEYSRNGVRLTNAVAMDCEMVGTGPTGKDSIIARVSIVNSFGELLFDQFVKPKENVTDYRTQISGVRASDLLKGKELFEVQRNVLNIIEGRILVGHSIKHDLDVLFISHPRSLIRDTAVYKPFRQHSSGRTPSLKKLCAIILGVDIQTGEHSSVEDAQAVMLLYLRSKREWEKHLKLENHLKSRRRKKIAVKVTQSEA